MGAIKLSGDEFNSTYNNINKATNEGVIDAMRDLAGLLRPHEGESAIVDQAIANCRNLADTYNNGFFESLRALKGTFDSLFDLTEYLEKSANIGGLSKVDTSFEAGKMDASKVMI